MAGKTPTSHHRTGATPALTCDRQPVAQARHRSTPQNLNASARQSVTRPISGLFAVRSSINGTFAMSGAGSAAYRFCRLVDAPE
jgi:hypothetical protein